KGTEMVLHLDGNWALRNRDPRRHVRCGLVSDIVQDTPIVSVSLGANLTRTPGLPRHLTSWPWLLFVGRSRSHLCYRDSGPLRICQHPTELAPVQHGVSCSVGKSS